MDNEPYIVPIYFAYELDHLYGFSTPGRKLELMRSNPKVCVEADEITNHFQWTSVIVSGQFEEFPDRPEFREKRLNAEQELEKRMLWWQTAYASRGLRTDDASTPIFYSIQISAMTGRRAIPEAADFKFVRISLA